ncbi:hypothetical protein SARC_10408 [Sphaeroforma arctica JP610]|uniref:Uncharacterized protein n=1 Tax=Sphaeroforma arctica JP610 TaxID=667725 RepID=A0A0L0FM71_9EUKA|nr:hypothetical protein SARC_10408 [Sphaeroforma arctica JP610]KNC77123.1 hypothetical protein SARC_10408 [Sphaeroforma arctica JP610]|eukprot:XP_014151025.1 hypothetical protein SARC_10408 [Sphaeroforma arctica JP610]
MLRKLLNKPIGVLFGGGNNEAPPVVAKISGGVVAKTSGGVVATDMATVEARESLVADHTQKHRDQPVDENNDSSPSTRHEPSLPDQVPTLETDLVSNQVPSASLQQSANRSVPDKCSVRQSSVNARLSDSVDREVHRDDAVPHRESRVGEVPNILEANDRTLDAELPVGELLREHSLDDSPEIYQLSPTCQTSLALLYLAQQKASETRDFKDLMMEVSGLQDIAITGKRSAEAQHVEDTSETTEWKNVQKRHCQAVALALIGEEIDSGDCIKQSDDEARSAVVTEHRQDEHVDGEANYVILKTLQELLVSDGHVSAEGLSDKTSQTGSKRSEDRPLGGVHETVECVEEKDSVIEDKITGDTTEQSDREKRLVGLNVVDDCVSSETVAGDEYEVADVIVMEKAHKVNAAGKQVVDKQDTDHCDTENNLDEKQVADEKTRHVREEYLGRGHEVKVNSGAIADEDPACTNDVVPSKPSQLCAANADGTDAGATGSLSPTHSCQSSVATETITNEFLEATTSAHPTDTAQVTSNSQAGSTHLQASSDIKAEVTLLRDQSRNSECPSEVATTNESDSSFLYTSGFSSSQGSESEAMYHQLELYEANNHTQQHPNTSTLTARRIAAIRRIDSKAATLTFPRLDEQFWIDVDPILLQYKLHLESAEVTEFLESDLGTPFDKYLLVAVFVYYVRAHLLTPTLLDFFCLLHLASDMEEDDRTFRDNIVDYILEPYYSGSRTHPHSATKGEHTNHFRVNTVNSFFAHKHTLCQRIGWSTCVSQIVCSAVFLRCEFPVLDCRNRTVRNPDRSVCWTARVPQHFPSLSYEYRKPLAPCAKVPQSPVHRKVLPPPPPPPPPQLPVAADALRDEANDSHRKRKQNDISDDVETTDAGSRKRAHIVLFKYVNENRSANARICHKTTHESEDKTVQLAPQEREAIQIADKSSKVLETAEIAQKAVAIQSRIHARKRAHNTDEKEPSQHTANKHARIDRDTAESAQQMARERVSEIDQEIGALERTQGIHEERSVQNIRVKVVPTDAMKLKAKLARPEIYAVNKHTGDIAQEHRYDSGTDGEGDAEARDQMVPDCLGGMLSRHDKMSNDTVEV